jgi:hypothetical protein
MINIEKMNKREFVLGIAIIVFCITLHTMLHPPVINTTVKVDITPIYNVSTTTNKEGNVKVYVK